MIKKELINLGKLKPEQKKAYWSKTISGSQAWMLLNEPYNLLRDKLEANRIHKSKYDSLNFGKMQSISNYAMEQGNRYESFVMDEIRTNNPNVNYSYVDETFSLNWYKDGKIDHSVRLTSTPDYFVKEGDKITFFGDIKCSTQADDEATMRERYYPQILHNAYILNCFQAELTCKKEITRPYYVYSFEFTQQDFDDYENKLQTFFSLLEAKFEDGYDWMLTEETIKEEKEKTTTMIYEVNDQDKETLIKLKALKDKEKEIKAAIKALEDVYKENYSNAEFNLDNITMIIKSTTVKGSIDYKELLQKYYEETGINLIEKENQFRKPDTIRKTITFKEKK